MAQSSWLRDPEDGRPCTIVAEIAQAHDGSLGLAHAFIDAVAEAGADAVKFQTHIAKAESTPAEPWRTRFSSEDETRFDYWRRMEFGETAWQELRKHAEERDLLFLSTPFSLEAVALLSRVGVAGWKVASGELMNHALIDAVAASGLPVMLSTGMSAEPEIDAAVARVFDAGAPLCVMQSTSLYPCPPEQVGLNVVSHFRSRYGCAVGLSDHSGTIFPGLAAATLGLDVLEVHVTLSREMFGPDVAVSVTTAELRDLVRGVRFVERMRAAPVDKTRVPESVATLREIFTQSIVATEDLPAGTVLEEAHLATRKPGTGIPANALPRLVGRRLRRDVQRDTALSPEDLA